MARESASAGTTVHSYTNQTCAVLCLGHGDDREAWKKVDMIPANMNDELADIDAKMEHYQDRVADLNKTVDELR